ncbi:uncharacterized protein FMAN_08083 [Fusarium mangiferae]|uniref:Uncharacterized protein n=1 Tax=Fusarium mangiferae TaxID=192010 RepID=A0A1L7TVD0_FUSMA|nr:uncharacterized protein FMAN_08083 [Fusarium mangiferae]CVL01959.1 uncharacterized protein FMAN_08083 [Fusarium mangiferae]
MFESNDYLSVDLEHPRKAALVRVLVEDDLASTGTAFKFTCVDFRDSAAAEKLSPYMSHHYPLTTEMFDTDFLRLDLEHPEQVILIPTKYNSQILMESDVEEVVAKMKESRDCFGEKKTRSLATETFETNDILRFDLEHPEQAIIIPTRYNSRIYIERDAKEVVAKMKESCGRFAVMRRDKILKY